MKRTLYWAAVALQLGTLIVMAASRELRLASSRTVVLATVPVDPRDLFRGDYVQLRYRISTVPTPSDATFTPGETVWIPLHPAGDVWEAGEPTDVPSDEGGPYIMGRVTSAAGGVLRVEYGIEQYFVPEGRGRAIERLPHDTLRVEVALDDAGRPAIRRLVVDGQPVDFTKPPNG